MMRKLAIVFCIVMMCSYNSFALIAHDPTANVNALRQIADQTKRHVEQVRQWKEQAEHFKHTISHFTEQQQMMKDQLASFTGIRNIKDLESQIDSLIYEMDGIDRNRNVLNEMLGSPDPKISDEGNSILRKYQLFDVCQKKGSKRLENICKEEILNKAGTIETADKIKKKMKSKMREVQNLSKKASMSKDIKESQDLANAISLKQSEINQLQHQWQTSVDEANLREKLIEQKKREAFWEHQKNAPLPTFNINKFK